MRTIIYVDGYNLFYSLLTGSPYKWLDLYTLFDNCIIKQIEPKTETILVKYFTAPVLGSLASDPEAEPRQAHYHRALKATGKVEIIKGFHQKAITTGIPIPAQGEKNSQGKVQVQIMEEKQTDVNIGLHMYRDIMLGNCDQIVLCSNDADLEPALEMIKSDCQKGRIGVILPRRNDTDRKATRLLRHAHWKRQIIKDEELEQSQLPEHLLDHRNRTIKRPEKWQP
ncbi:MAG: NYN domain-containing protein [Candidatus Sedimenticola sp. (ex Thyasira tokunagai)]